MSEEKAETGATVTVGDNEYMTDAKGNLVPIEAVSAASDISESSQHLAKLAIEISDQVNQFKTSS